MGFETNRAALIWCSGTRVARRQPIEGRAIGLRRSDGKMHAVIDRCFEKLVLEIIIFVAQLAWGQSVLLVAAVFGVIVPHLLCSQDSSQQVLLHCLGLLIVDIYINSFLPKHRNHSIPPLRHLGQGVPHGSFYDSHNRLTPFVCYRWVGSGH